MTDTIQFWKDRLEKATVLHHSIYAGDINEIDIRHKEALKEVTGRVLDVGCGYGRTSEWFEDYTGIDFSPDFIAKAKELYPKKNFILGNAFALPFADKEFDWAVSIGCERMFKEQNKMEIVNKEMKRVAKKVILLDMT